MEGSGGFEIVSLVKPPGDFLFPLIVIDSPGFEHASWADNAWDLFGAGPLSHTVVVGQPDAVIVEDVDFDVGEVTPM